MAPPARGRRGAPRAAAAGGPRGPRGGAAAVPVEPAATVADAATEAQIAAALAQKAPARGRGGARGRGAPTVAEGAPAQEAVVAPEPEQPAAEAPAPPSGRPPFREQRRGGRGRGGRGRELGPSQAPPRGERPPTQQAISRDARGGPVESLIARQNVLFEEFASQQQQALREIQRSVQTAGRGGRVAGDAVAPIILPKVGVFLDVPNVVFAAEDAGVRVHFGKLLEYLTQGRQLVRATAYAPITDDPMTRFEHQRFVHPVLGQGYKVVTKPWKRFADGGMKANFDIELAVDILTMSDRLDIVVLLSGDSDFKRVIELVESKGVRVEVCAFAQSTAAELRAVADQYIDLGSILDLVRP